VGEGKKPKWLGGLLKKKIGNHFPQVFTLRKTYPRKAVLGGGKEGGERDAHHGREKGEI